MNEVDIKVGLNGVGTIKIDGTDISNKVMGFQMEAQPGFTPKIIFEMRAGHKIEGVMEVYWGTPNSYSGTDLIIDALESFDPRELEQEALQELGWGDNSSFTHRIIEIMKRKVAENANQSGASPPQARG